MSHRGVWERRRVDASVTIPREVAITDAIKSIVGKLRRIAERDRSSTLDPATIEWETAELLSDPLLGYGVTLREAWAAGVPLTASFETQVRVTALTRPVIDGKTIEVQPDTWHIAIPVGPPRWVQ